MGFPGAFHVIDRADLGARVEHNQQVSVVAGHARVDAAIDFRGDCIAFVDDKEHIRGVLAGELGLALRLRATGGNSDCGDKGFRVPEDRQAARVERLEQFGVFAYDRQHFAPQNTFQVIQWGCGDEVDL